MKRTIAGLEQSLKELERFNESYRAEAERLRTQVEIARDGARRAEERLQQAFAERDRIIRLTEIFTSIQIMPLQVGQGIQGNLPGTLRR